MSGPSVAVVMPVHNAARYLDEAVASIVGQSFADFEFVIRDDGSTDGSLEMLRRWADRDRRIRLFEGARLGPAGSSNWIVNAAGAPLVARMDADDVAYPERLRRQMDVLHSSPDTVLLGTMIDMVDRRGKIVRPYDFARLARWDYSAPFAHASILFRRDAFDRVGGYRAGCEHWEDLDFYLRMAEQGRIAVVAEPLLAYRAHTSTRLTAEREAVERCLDRRYRCLEAHRQDGNYDLLVSRPVTSDAKEKCHPRVFVALGSMELWSGGSPNVLGRLIRRGDLKWNRESAVAMIWAGWARLSPSSLRWLLTTLVRMRNLVFKRRFVPGQVYPWSPRRECDRDVPVERGAGHPMPGPARRLRLEAR